MMTWSHSTYLKMIIKLKVEIDMSNYPMWYIISPQMANKEHATQVIEGWNNGAIKWIPLSDDDVKLCEKELAELLKKGRGDVKDDTGMSEENGK